MEIFKSYRLPDAYLKFLADAGNVNKSYFYDVDHVNDPSDGDEYILYCQQHLMKNSYSETSKNFECLASEERYFKAIESRDGVITKEAVQKSFVIGVCDDGGNVFINSTDHSLWIIYKDLFLKKLASSFEFFIDHAEFDGDY